MDVDENPSGSAPPAKKDPNHNDYDEENGSDSDSDDEETGGHPLTVTARKPAVRPLPPAAKLNSPLAILRHFVHRLMDAWPAYQVALTQNSGGAETPEKDEWLRDEIVKLLVKPDQLESDDLVEWLEDVLSEDFQLLIEDGSTDVAAQGLLRVVGAVRDRFIARTAPPPTAASAGLVDGRSEREAALAELSAIVDALKF